MALLADQISEQIAMTKKAIVSLVERKTELESQIEQAESTTVFLQGRLSSLQDVFNSMVDDSELASPLRANDEEEEPHV